MSISGPERSTVPRRSFGVQQPLIDGRDEAEQAEPTLLHRVLSRMSFKSNNHRPSFSSVFGRHRGEDETHGAPTSTSDRPPIPTMTHSSTEVYATPLPTLSMIVLSITMLGEFLCANVSTPFLLFMVKGFGDVNGEAEVAFWTGIIVSTFFLTQFITSLLWATVAEKHGRRAVLIISLLGSAFTCLIFGTATTLQQAISIRLLQGIFAGAIGVARGSVAFITDPTNEGRAYAILGFCWGLGGVTGAIIGGAFERPAAKWPDFFKDLPLLTTYPYLLPCAIAALITLTGAFLACFLDRDGGPREGAIRLGPEKPDGYISIPEESVPPSPILEPVNRRPSFVASIQRKISSLIGRRGPDATTPRLDSPALPTPVPLTRTRTFSSRADGSAYGYGGNRLASNTPLYLRKGSTTSSLRRRRGSNIDSVRDGLGEVGDLNFAQRLLMANENAVTNIADLWVAAAMNVDNEDPFESDTEADSDGEQNNADLEQVVEEEEDDVLPDTRGRPSLHVPHHPRSGRPSQSTLPQPYSRRQSHARSPLRSSLPHSPGTPMSRRFSTTPSIFAHPGVRTPSAVLDAQQLLLKNTDVENPVIDLLRPQTADADIESLAEKQPSLASQIPVLVIVQYGMLALHTTTHDQVFMSYLVSDYNAGGLNLNAGHFAQLIALMCLAQIAYQFYLYPNIGPPRGRFSHLAMFRVGSLLFIPAYLSVILYRPFANAGEDGNVLVMSALALSTAVRYCGSTFGYTSISILLNYMTPPAAVGYANGIAQSIVSLARCVGPVIGGYLWSMSIQDGPSGYPLGFLICSAFCAFTVFQSYLIR